MSDLGIKRIHGDGYGPVGECIYCGATSAEKELTKEHAISKAIRGRIILHDASCLDCADVTKKLEDHVTRGVWNDFRIVNDMHSKGRRNPSKLRTVFVRNEDGAETHFDLPADKHPGINVMLRFPEPRILSGSTSLDVDAQITAFSTREVTSDNVGGASQLFGRVSVDALAYARAIAKMAHGVAVWRLGLDGFFPLIPPIVRGLATDIDTFDHVGCEPEPRQPRAEATDHVFTTELVSYPNSGWVVLVRLWLFSCFRCSDGFGPPTYVVIVGRPNDETLSRFQADHFYPTMPKSRRDRNRDRLRP